MQDIKRTFRLWMIGTLSFLFLTVAAILAVSWFYMNTLVRSEQQLIRDLFDRKLSEHLSVIPEELYLGLSNLDLHRKQLSEVIAGRAHLTFDFVGTTVQETNEGPGDQAWNADEDASRKTVRLYFGETYLGAVRILLSWPKSPLIDAFNKIMWISLAAILTLTAVWIVFLYILQTRSYTPLLKKLLNFERTQAIGQATLMLAHDFRKPLSMAKMATRILRSEKRAQKTAADLERMAARIDEAMAHADLLISDVMDFCGSKQPELKPVSVTAAVHESRELGLRERNTPTLTVSYALRHTHKISAEHSRIVRVLSNIIENAAQAMNGAGAIHIKSNDVTAGAKIKAVEISVSNTNSFIPAELREKIFELFFTQGKKDGTGLGLAICRKIVESHGGSIRCYSSESAGTEFRVTIPAASELETQASEPQQEAS